MKRRMLGWLCVLLMAWQAPALAEEIPEQVIHDALMANIAATCMPAEAAAEGHAVLGTETDGREMRVYLAASVGTYGFLGDYFINMSGWGGPCTLVLRQVNGRWRLKEFLEIESYSDIPEIMPKEYAKKYLDGRYDADGITAQIDRQLGDYLDAHFPGAVRGSYADGAGELPGVITVASNLLTYSMDNIWPLGCTTREAVEDGVRMCFAKSWQPDGDNPEQIVTETQGVTEHWGGTTGTVTFTKSRKEDGMILETITARATLRDLTVTLRDDSGSVTYVFPLVYDGYWQYFQPAVTREGACRMDTVGLDTLELKGERVSAWAVEDQQQVSDTERFTLLKDCSLHRLVFERQVDGQWQTAWENKKIVPCTSEDVRFNFFPGAGTQETDRFSRAVKDALQIMAGEESPSLYIELSRDAQDAWQVDTYESLRDGEIACLFDDFMLGKDHALSADGKVWFFPGQVNRWAADFDPWRIWEKRMEMTGALWDFGLSEREDYLSVMDDFGQIAGSEALYAAPSVKATVPVYADADRKAPRGANGKAALSLNGPFAVLCREGDWLMVVYETGAGKYRTGWVDSAAHATLAAIRDVTGQARFISRAAVVRRETKLVDDPINMANTLCTLKKGAEVTVLWDQWEDVCYVQARVSGKTYRGFVEKSLVE